MATCLLGQALGYLSDDFIDAVLVAAEKVIVEDHGINSCTDFAVLMAIAKGNHRMVRGILGLDGIIYEENITQLFDDTGRVIWDMDVLHLILKGSFSDKHAELISRYLIEGNSKDRWDR